MQCGSQGQSRRLSFGYTAIASVVRGHRFAGFMTFTTALMVVFATLAVGALVYQALGTRRDARSNPPPGQLYSVNRHRLHLLVLGEQAPTVVLEAGIGASSLSWQLVHAAVARFCRVCAYDRAGLAWSQAGSGPLSGHRSVAELRRALSAADLPPPYILVGHSFGAYVVRLFAALHPAEVAGLVLLDPLEPEDWQVPTRAARRRLMGGILCARVATGLAAVGIVRFTVGRFLRGDRHVARAVLRSFPSEATPAVEGLVRQIGKLPVESWQAIQAHWTRTWSFWTLAHYLAALPRYAKELVAAEVGQTASTHRSPTRGPHWEFPVLVVSAATTAPEALARHRATAARSSCGHHHTMASSGHWVQLDAPTDVVEAIRTVVKLAKQPQSVPAEVSEHEGSC